MTYGVVFGNVSDLFVVVGSCQCGQTVRMEPATSWVELDSVILGQLGAKRVDGDDQGTTVSFKL